MKLNKIAFGKFFKKIKGKSIEDLPDQLLEGVDQKRFIEVGTEWMKLTESIRQADELEKIILISDKDCDNYKDFDPRALFFMMGEMAKREQKWIQAVKEDLQ